MLNKTYIKQKCHRPKILQTLSKNKLQRLYKPFFWHGYRWVSTVTIWIFFLSQIWQKPSENHSFNSKNGAWNGLPYHKDSNHSNEMHCPFHSDHLNFDLKRTKPKSFQFDLILDSALALVSVLIVFRFGFLFKLYSFFFPPTFARFSFFFKWNDYKSLNPNIKSPLKWKKDLLPFLFAWNAYVLSTILEQMWHFERFAI